jgi:6-phosphogluconolactonase
MPDPGFGPTGRPAGEPARSPSRRAVLGSLAAIAGAAALPLLGGTAAAAGPASTAPTSRRTATTPTPAKATSTRATTDLVYFNTWQGTYIYGAWFNPADGDLTPIGPVGEAEADWAVKHPALPILYVATMQVGGVVDTFRIDPATGLLTSSGELSTGGTGLGGGGVSYVGVDRPSDTLLVTNFEDGFIATVAVSANGALQRPVSIVQDTGSGPNPRQTGPHPHHVEIDPSGRFALVADFGADRVVVYRFDRATRVLSTGGPAGAYHYATAPGSGPRRVAFHPAGRTLYLLNELSADIQTLGWAPKRGRLVPRQTLSIDTPDFTGTPSASDLAVSRDGRFVYAGNRGENSVVVFAVDPRTDLLSAVQRIPCGGLTPWSFSVHPSGRWLLVANKASNTVNVFDIDQRSGKLTDTGKAISVPSPDSVTFCHF